MPTLGTGDIRAAGGGASPVNGAVCPPFGVIALDPASRYLRGKVTGYLGGNPERGIAVGGRRPPHLHVSPRTPRCHSRDRRPAGASAPAGRLVSIRGLRVSIRGFAATQPARGGGFAATQPASGGAAGLLDPRAASPRG